MQVIGRRVQAAMGNLLRNEPLHEKTWLSHMRIAKVQISLCIHWVWSAPLLFTTRWYNTFSFYIRNFKTLACVCSWAGRFESYLVANPEDRFSHDEARIVTSAWGLIQSQSKETLEEMRCPTQTPKFEPPHEMICVPSEDSDQPGNLPSLIEDFNVHSVGS